MNFQIAREALLKPLQQVLGVVERRQTLPVLANVLVVVRKDRLSLTATDLEVEMVASTDLSAAQEGEITVPARKLADICKALPDGAQISFTTDTDKERVTVKSGKSRFNLATLPPRDFPNIEEVKATRDIAIGQSALKYLLEKTQFAMAQQDVRYYLNGLLLELDGAILRAVATDGHRLAVSETAGDFGAGDKQHVIIPRKGVMELSRLLEATDQELKISIGNNHLRVESADWTFTSKLIDGKFPDYERVIPKGGDKEVLARTVEFKQALVRTSILSNEKYRGVKLTLAPGSLQARAHNPEMEEAEEELEVEYQGGGLEIGFNVNYLVDALAAVDSEQVRLVFSDANSSCLVQSDQQRQSRYVIMPMRL